MTQRTTVDLTSLLTDEHRAFLAGLPARNAMYAGWTMKEGDDDDEGDDPDDDEDEDDDPETEFRTGGKTFKVGDINRLMAREKRQGKKSALTQLATELGFDSIDDLKAAAAKAKPKSKAKQKDDEDEDDEAAERARERETAAERRERQAAQKERRADLRGALRDHGVAREDLDEAFALLDRRVDDDYDEDELDDAIAELRETRAGKALFEADEDERPAPRRTPAASVPRGRGPRGRQKPQPKKPGEAGRERARQRGWIKDDA